MAKPANREGRNEEARGIRLSERSESQREELGGETLRIGPPRENVELRRASSNMETVGLAVLEIIEARRGAPSPDGWEESMASALRATRVAQEREEGATEGMVA